MIDDRYVAVIGGGDDAAGEHRIQGMLAELRQIGFRTVCDDAGLLIVAAAALPVTISPDRRRRTLGRPFPALDDPPSTTASSLHGAASSRVNPDPDGIGGQWGGFVTFVHDIRSNSVHLLRPAFGMLPCYFACNDDGVLVVSSDVAILSVALGVTPTVDPAFLVGYLAREQLRTAATGLVGISELLGGQTLVAVDRRWHVEACWSPWRFAAQSEQMISSADAAAHLRRIVNQCTAQWAAPYGTAVLSLSGGLDSAIVAACLANTDIALTALNLATQEAAGDERHYARAVAGALGIGLAERRERLGLVNLCRSEAAHLPRPLARAFAQSGDVAHLDQARRTGADVFFGGGGGDNVFCYLHSAAPVADRLAVSGVSRAMLATAIDVSRLTRTGLPRVLRKALRRASADPAHPWPVDLRFLSHMAIAQIGAAPYHPWLVPPAGALPGKAAHIALIMAFQNHMEGFGRERVLPKISPLMSLPVIETCLRIPSWMWCEGGINRALARTAFAADLPAVILSRTTKSTPGGFATAVYERDRGVIRDMLLGGVLADQNVLDLAAIELVLAQPGPTRGSEALRILRLVDVEAWARSWSGRSFRF